MDAGRKNPDDGVPSAACALLVPAPSPFIMALGNSVAFVTFVVFGSGGVAFAVVPAGGGAGRERSGAVVVLAGEGGVAFAGEGADTKKFGICVAFAGEGGVVFAGEGGDKKKPGGFFVLFAGGGGVVLASGGVGRKKSGGLFVVFAVGGGVVLAGGGGVVFAGGGVGRKKSGTFVAFVVFVVFAGGGRVVFAGASVGRKKSGADVVLAGGLPGGVVVGAAPEHPRSVCAQHQAFLAADQPAAQFEYPASQS
mmetsp:Transcript_2464/g.6912  ORF Transcript_2464/g.6912 Transcript_2464/m.6912 type:complete len:251 (+) Transcript_2464:438-1190(+)